MDSLTYIKKWERKFTISVYAGQALIKIITITTLGVSVFLLLDYIFFLPSPIRLVFFILVCATGIGVSAIYKFNPIQLLEQKFPEFKGRLFASLSYYRKEAGYSNELIDQIRLQTSKLISEIEISPIIKKQFSPLLKPFIIGCIAVIICITLLPSPKFGRIKRFFLPKYKLLSLTICPGNAKLAYGDSATIEVIPHGIVPRKLYLITNGTSVPVYKSLGFKTTLEITKDITYYAKLQDVSSDTYRVLVMIRPWLKNIEFSYNYPNYTGVPPFVSNVPSIEALFGTQIKIKAEANVSLDSAILLFSNTKPNEFQVDGAKLQTKFTLTQNDSYQISLVASNGLKNTTEKWSIRVLEDELPKVEVIFPGVDIELPVSMKIPIIFHTSDDYGITSSKLISDRGEWNITYTLNPDTVVICEWDLSDITLLPGDIIKYWIEVQDNDAIKGPKSAKSQEYRVYFPAIEEIYEHLTQQETATINELEKTLKELEASVNQLEKTTLHLQPPTSSQDKEEIKKTLDKMKQIQTQLKEIGTRLNETYKTAEKSWAVDRELAEKLKELQILYREINLPQLTEAMRKVEEAIQKNPELLQQALKNLTLTQEELKQRIERTIELLKQFRNEQLLKSLAEKAKELEQWQKTINEQTVTADSLAPLSKEEQALQEEVDKMAKELDNLAKEMPALSKELKQEAERASITVGQLSKAASQLSKGKKSLKLQAQILNQLSILSSNLNSLYEQTVQHSKEQVSREIKKLESDLLFLSFEEENIKGKPLDMAFRQEAIIKGTKIALQQLQALTKITPFIPHSTQKHLSNALNSMEQAKRNLEQNNILNGENDQKTAMSELNSAIANLMDAESALQKSCSASGIPSLMQQLSQLTQNQQSLNQLVQSLLPLNLMPSDMGDQLMQLAGQQQALADELQQIAQGLKGKVLGDLGSQAQEMERIAQELSQGITKEIVERQKEVLKHLLDSQKSIYTKKHSRRRIAEPGKNFINLPSLPTPELITKRGISQKEILNALKQNYPKEYELLIRAYFRALSIE